MENGMRSVFALGASLLLAASPATSKDLNDQYVVEGVGQIKCDAFANFDAQSSKEIGAISAWLDGFLSAHNRLLDDTFDLTSWQTNQLSLTLLRQFCVANPDATVERSAAALVNYYGQDRVTQREEAVSVSNGTQTVLVYASVLERIKTKLADQGYNNDDVTEALKAFQQKNDLVQSGLPDQQTLVGLFRSK